MDPQDIQSGPEAFLDLLTGLWWGAMALGLLLLVWALVLVLLAIVGYLERHRR